MLSLTLSGTSPEIAWPFQWISLFLAYKKGMTMTSPLHTRICLIRTKFHKFLSLYFRQTNHMFIKSEIFKKNNITRKWLPLTSSFLHLSVHPSSLFSSAILKNGKKKNIWWCFNILVAEHEFQVSQHEFRLGKRLLCN